MSSTPSRLSAVNGYPRAAAAHTNGIINGSSAKRAASMTRTATIDSAGHGLGAASEEEERDEDPIHAMLKARWDSMQASIDALFGGDGAHRRGSA